jgi:hypothetical protein
VFKIAQLFLLVWLLAGLVGCESSSSVTAADPEKVSPEAKEESSGNVEVVEVEDQEIEANELVYQSEEAEQKYRLASQLLEFAGPIDDLSSESRNVRWLAVDLLQTAIQRDPTQFKYYRDLFMTYMVLQEPVRAINAIESAARTPALSKEVADFQSLVFGALEFASLIDSEQ